LEREGCGYQEHVVWRQPKREVLNRLLLAQDFDRAVNVIRKKDGATPLLEAAAPSEDTDFFGGETLLRLARASSLKTVRAVRFSDGASALDLLLDSAHEAVSSDDDSGDDEDWREWPMGPPGRARPLAAPKRPRPDHHHAGRGLPGAQGPGRRALGLDAL
jgi:hypothetical protein